MQPDNRLTQMTIKIVIQEGTAINQDTEKLNLVA